MYDLKRRYRFVTPPFPRINHCRQICAFPGQMGASNVLDIFVVVVGVWEAVRVVVNLERELFFLAVTYSI